MLSCAVAARGSSERQWRHGWRWKVMRIVLHARQFAPRNGKAIARVYHYIRGCETFLKSDW